MTALPTLSSLALKEWAVAVNALAKGEQIIVLRKGGIHREDKEFRVVHPEFLLYPTFEHQKAELLQDKYYPDLEETLQGDDVSDLVTFSCWSKVTEIFELKDDETLECLSSYHIWTNDYAQKRLHWRPKRPLTVALLRVYRLQQPKELPILGQYDGCKSWVELGQEVPLGHMAPVLTDHEYQKKASAVRQAVRSSAANKQETTSIISPAAPFGESVLR